MSWLPWPMQHKLGLIQCVAQLKVAKVSAYIGAQFYGKTLSMKNFQQTGLWWLYLPYLPWLPWPMQHKLGLILCVAQLKVGKATA
jgi:hypothetical protein